jgi:N-acetylglucosamine malate deacetylase 1
VAASSAASRTPGGEVFVQMLTVGDTRDASPDGYSSADERGTEIARVAELLGYDDYELVFPGNTHHLRLDAIPQAALIEAIEESGSCSIRALRPDHRRPARPGELQPGPSCGRHRGGLGAAAR